MSWRNPEANRQPAAGHSFRSQLCDVFVKIGGSILDKESLTAELVPSLTALAAKRRIVILPGGGQAVKRIKANYQCSGTDFGGCWVAAVLCLDVNAGILASYSKELRVVTCAQEIEACFAAGQVAVLAAAGVIFNSLQLTPDFITTTDSMGIYFAKMLGASRYVVVSDVHGIYRQEPRHEVAEVAIPNLTLEELERLPSSKLDPIFPQYFRRHAVPTVVVNGRYPDRVRAAICGEPTMGTEIAMPAA
jgi:aspartokinase-like uncharacterized kinase